MTAEAETIQNLKKVRVLIEAGLREDDFSLTKEPIPVEFIIGLGQEGFTPFEFQLLNRQQGDQLAFNAERDQLHEFFHPVCIPVPSLPDTRGPLHFKVRIERVTTPENREIIKQMARIADCGDGHCGDQGCGCGCGC